MDASLSRRWVSLLWLALLVVTAWAYWPGLNGPMLLDDYANLRPLERLDLDADFAVDVVEGNRSGLLGRPVSMLSFTAERLYFDAGTHGQKRFGLFLHLLNATLVLLLARSLLLAASQPRAAACAILIAGAWLTLPLLLSTTLYVVQRMTLLSALFSLLALLLYSTGRQSRTPMSWAWFALCGLSVLLATLSKENGLLAVPLIVAIEVFVFGFRDDAGEPRRRIYWLHGALVIAPLLLLLLVAIFVPERLVGGYQHRSFSLGERLLTQGRVLIDYVLQILWVDVHRLGVYQDDFRLSTGLFSPPSTAAALLLWMLAACGVLAAAILQKFRLAAFGLAFFMIGHAMESTVIPLEIYFEHRNYLPSFGLLFGLFAAANQLQSRWQPLRGWLAMLAIVFIGRNVLLLGSQSVVWSEEHLLNMEAVNHHPESERALLALGQVYANEGHLEAALELVKRANQVTGRTGATAQVLEALFHCIAGRQLSADMFTAPQPEDTEIRRQPFGGHVYYMTRLVIEGRCSRESGILFADAMDHWLAADERVRATRQIYGSMMLLENQLERYPQALGYAILLRKKNPEDVMGLQFTLYLASMLGRNDLADLAKSELVELRDRGKLSRQEAYNLQLFLN